MGEQEKQRENGGDAGHCGAEHGAGGANRFAAAEPLGLSNNSVGGHEQSNSRLGAEVLARLHLWDFLRIFVNPFINFENSDLVNRFLPNFLIAIRWTRHRAISDAETLQKPSWKFCCLDASASVDWQCGIVEELRQAFDGANGIHNGET